MRRTLLTLALLALSYGWTAPESRAEPSPREICEAYCVLQAISCYLGPGLLLGRDKCDAQYQGCVQGCITAVNEL